jgi:Ca-activated chloride channel family protein
MVMIYPREGAAVHTHPAALVEANWVTDEQREAAQTWIDFLHEDEQQRQFMQEGFRPSTQLPVGCPICTDYGVQPNGPKTWIDANRIPPKVGQQAVAAWGDVKNTGVVVFVVDTSLAMAGSKWQSAQAGVIEAIDQMYERNLVGLVTFSNSIHQQIMPAPLPQNRFVLADALRQAQVGGGSDLFDAIAQGVTMAATAAAPEKSIRGVVVLAGGPASSGSFLSDLVTMAVGGKQIRTCRGFEGETQCVDEDGRSVDRATITGVPSVSDGAGAVKVYFIGIGMSDTDLQIGRIIAETTRSNFVGTTVKDLSTVVGVFKGYF